MLFRPWFTPFILLFWGITSGWLVVTKILPSLRPGSPPGYQALHVSDESLVPVGWTVEWNERPVGWALTELERGPDGALVVTSRLRLDRLPLGQLVPRWLKALLPAAVSLEAAADIETRGRMEMDSSGQLRRFSSIVRIPAVLDEISLEGSCDDGELQMHVQAGDLRYDVSRRLPDRATMGDEFAPQAMLPGLYEGRRWTVPVYNPLRAAHAPLDMLMAEVGGEDIFYWDNRLVRVNVVTYREDSSTTTEPRCRLWVDKEGRVLKQETAILNARVAFVRRSAEATAWFLRESGRGGTTSEATGGNTPPRRAARGPAPESATP
jgi:hypothetical protein